MAVKRFLRQLWLSVFIAGVSFAPPTRSAPNPILPAPRNPPISASAAPLPREFRKLLEPRMERHGDQMTVLMVAIVFLNYGLAKRVANDLAKEPALSHLTETKNDLFSEYQAQLAERAREVSAAAQARDDKRLSKAFGAMAGTCMECHSVYLYPQKDAAASATEDWQETQDKEGAAAGISL